MDFDIIEMGAPFEGDVLGRGLASEMPQWVADMIDMNDYVDYLKAPVGTWDDKTYRVSVDGDCHTYDYRTDYYDNSDFADAWKELGGEGEWEPPTTWDQVNAHAKFLAGKTDPLTGLAAYGFLDPMKGWGGFSFYFLEDPRDALCQASRRSGLAVRSRHDEAAREQPRLRAGDRGRDGSHRDRRRLSSGPDQRRSRDHRVPAVPRRNGRGGELVGATWGRPRAPRTLRWWAMWWRSGPIRRPSGCGTPSPAPWEEKMNESPNLAYIGWGVYVMATTEQDELKNKAAWSAAAHLGGKDLSLWTSAYPSGFQPYRTSHFQYDEWEAAGYDRAYIENYLGANLDSYNHPNGAIEPRIPGIFQYYSVAEDELAKGYAGQYKSAQETADAIAAALGEDHRPDRPRQPDSTLQGLARHVSAGTAPARGFGAAHSSIDGPR